MTENCDINETRNRTKYTYDPYGGTMSGGAGSYNTSEFTGRENDGTGLYYYRARYYNPSIGRFINEDPIGFAGGLNPYAYVSDNPVSFVDPFGLKPGPPPPGTPPPVPPDPGNPPPNPNCISPNFAQSAAINLLSEIANSTGRTVGYGIGGSIGAGRTGFGFNLSGSLQLVVAPDGTAGLAMSYTRQVFSVASQGVGGILGIQFTSSTTQTVMDLQGYSLDIGGLAADGPGVSGDATFSGGNGGTDMGLTGTVGYGFGGFGHAGTVTQTLVTPFCTN